MPLLYLVGCVLSSGMLFSYFNGVHNAHSGNGMQRDGCGCEDTDSRVVESCATASFARSFSTPSAEMPASSLVSA